MAARASSGIAAALSTSSPASQGSCVFSACTNGTGVSSPEARAPEGGSIKRTRKPSFGMLTKTKTSSKLMRDHEWKDEVDKMRAVLDEQKKRYKEQARYLVNPDSRAMAFWDATTTAALAYTALITPVEVAFLSSGRGADRAPDDPPFIVDTWFVINRTVDIIFIIDILLQFFIMFEAQPNTDPRAIAKDGIQGNELFATMFPASDKHVRPVQDPTSHHFASKTGAIYVAHHRRIVQRYVFSVWFPLDVCSIIPSAMDFIDFRSITATASATEGAAATTSGPTVNPFLILRILRAARLIKLIRLLKYRRIYNRMASRIDVSHSTAVKFKVVVSVLLVSHWFACVFAMVATLHANPLDTYWTTRGFCDYSIALDTTVDMSRGIVEVCELNVFDWYMACFTWAMLVVTGCGGTDEFPSSTSTAENIVVTLLNLLAAIFWTMVLATFCDVITHANPEVTEFQQTMDELNIFMSNQMLPDLMRRRLREFFLQRKHVRVEQRANMVTQQMSSALQTEVTLYCYGDWLSRIYFLRGCEPPCLVQMAIAMQPVVFAPSESPPPRHFYVLKKGIVAYGPRLITSGKMWGEEIITQTLHEPFVARCMTYADAFTISREQFWEILNNFEASRLVVRRRARYLLLKRWMPALAKQRREELAASGGQPQTSSTSSPQDLIGRAIGRLLRSNSVKQHPRVGISAKLYIDPSAMDPDSHVTLETRVEKTEAAINGVRGDVKRVLALLEGVLGTKAGDEAHYSDAHSEGGEHVSRRHRSSGEHKGSRRKHGSSSRTSPRQRDGAPATANGLPALVRSTTLPDISLRARPNSTRSRSRLGECSEGSTPGASTSGQDASPVSGWM